MLAQLQVRAKGLVAQGPLLSKDWLLECSATDLAAATVTLVSGNYKHFLGVGDILAVKDSWGPE